MFYASQNRTEQNRTEQNRTEQNRTEQKHNNQLYFLVYSHILETKALLHNACKSAFFIVSKKLKAKLNCLIFKRFNLAFISMKRGNYGNR